MTLRSKLAFAGATAAAAQSMPEDQTTPEWAEDAAKCLLGQFLDLANSRECKACPMGYYGDQVGMTDCRMCTVGTTQPSAGQTQCLKCSAGSKESDEGSFGT